MGLYLMVQLQLFLRAFQPILMLVVIGLFLLSLSLTLTLSLLFLVGRLLGRSLEYQYQKPKQKGIWFKG